MRYLHLSILCTLLLISSTLFAWQQTESFDFTSYEEYTNALNQSQYIEHFETNISDLNTTTTTFGGQTYWQIGLDEQAKYTDYNTLTTVNATPPAGTIFPHLFFHPRVPITNMEASLLINDNLYLMGSLGRHYDQFIYSKSNTVKDTIFNYYAVQKNAVREFKINFATNTAYDGIPHADDAFNIIPNTGFALSGSQYFPYFTPDTLLGLTFYPNTKTTGNYNRLFMNKLTFKYSFPEIQSTDLGVIEGDGVVVKQGDQQTIMLTIAVKDGITYQAKEPLSGSNISQYLTGSWITRDGGYWSNTPKTPYIVEDCNESSGSVFSSPLNTDFGVSLISSNETTMTLQVVFTLNDASKYSKGDILSPTFTVRPRWKAEDFGLDADLNTAVSFQVKVNYNPDLTDDEIPPTYNLKYAFKDGNRATVSYTGSYSPWNYNISNKPISSAYSAITTNQEIDFGTEEANNPIDERSVDIHGLWVGAYDIKNVPVIDGKQSTFLADIRHLVDIEFEPVEGYKSGGFKVAPNKKVSYYEQAKEDAFFAKMPTVEAYDPRVTTTTGSQFDNYLWWVVFEPEEGGYYKSKVTVTVRNKSNCDVGTECECKERTDGVWEWKDGKCQEVCDDECECDKLGADYEWTGTTCQKTAKAQCAEKNGKWQCTYEFEENEDGDFEEVEYCECQECDAKCECEKKGGYYIDVNGTKKCVSNTYKSCIDIKGTPTNTSTTTNGVTTCTTCSNAKCDQICEDNGYDKGSMSTTNSSKYGKTFKCSCRSCGEEAQQECEEWGMTWDSDYCECTDDIDEWLAPRRQPKADDFDFDDLDDGDDIDDNLDDEPTTPKIIETKKVFYLTGFCKTGPGMMYINGDTEIKDTLSLNEGESQNINYRLKYENIVGHSLDCEVTGTGAQYVRPRFGTYYFEVKIEPKKSGIYDPVIHITATNNGTDKAEKPTVDVYIRLRVNCPFSHFEATASDAYADKVVLAWDAVANIFDTPTYYTITRDGVNIVSGTSLTANTYTDQNNLQLNRPYTYIITAHDKQGNSMSATCTGKAVITGTHIISKDTEGENYNQFVSKQQLNENSVFGNDSKPLMDTLYILNQDMMYIFAADGANNRYVLKRALYVPLENCEIGNANQKKLYFTGKTTNYVYAGNALKDMLLNGFITISGNDEEKVDIYLENFDIKKVRGKYEGISNNPKSSESGSDFRQGFTNPIAIHSDGVKTYASGKLFTANFHTKGYNYLPCGSEGMHKSGWGNAAVYSASIGIRPTAKRTIGQQETTVLVFDDIWLDGSRTNGMLDLGYQNHATNAGNNASSIDLGSSKGIAVFNGGRYKLSAAAWEHKDYGFHHTITIGYRDGTDATGGVGYGTSMTDCTVIINDGTFYTYKQQNGYNQGWFANPYDLRLPQNTYINGGTFPLGGEGEGYVYKIKVGNAKDNGGVAYYNSKQEQLCVMQTLSFDLTNQTNRMGIDATTGLLTNIEWTTLTGGYDLKYHIDEGRLFASSLTPEKRSDNHYYLQMFLPSKAKVYYEDGDEEVEWCEVPLDRETTNWTTIVPSLSESGVTILGDKKVETNLTNFYLFYGQFDENTINYARKEVGLLGELELRYMWEKDKNGDYRKNAIVSNRDSYSIESGIYMMMPFMSNQYYTITPPFDVNNIYVLEPYKTTSKTGYRGSQTYNSYINSQVLANADMAAKIIFSMAPDPLSGMGSGKRKNLINMLKDDAAIEPFKLVYYNPNLAGHSSAESHFQLKVQNLDDVHHLWDIETDEDKYSEKWDYVEPISVANGTYKTHTGVNINDAQIVMQKGIVYTMFFPSSLSDLYWDGKYILFEGYGPQNINGTNSWDPDTDIPTNENIWISQDLDNYSGKVRMQGNATFADYENTEDNLEDFYNPIYRSELVRQENGTQKYQFVRYDNTIVSPAESFLTLPTAPAQGLVHPSVMALNPSEKNANRTTPTMSQFLLKAWDNGGINILSFTRQNVAIYNVSGSKLWEGVIDDGEIKHISCTTGMYLIKSQGCIIKLIVK